MPDIRSSRCSSWLAVLWLAPLGSAWNDAFPCSKTTAAASTQAISMSTLISFAERPFEFLQFLSFLHFYCSQLQIWLLPVLK